MTTSHRSIFLHVDGDGPEIEVDGRRPIEYTDLPVSGPSKSALAVWISITGHDSTHSGDEQLVAAARAAAAVARDLPEVAVGFALSRRAGERLAFDVRREPAP